MTAWLIEYIEEAQHDFDKLDHSQQIKVLKAIQKVAQNPLPTNKGGYGKPLGHKPSSNLTGMLKIKLVKEGLRVVYKNIINDNVMRIIVISVRNDEIAYKLAESRINALSP